MHDRGPAGNPVWAREGGVLTHRTVRCDNDNVGRVHEKM